MSSHAQGLRAWLLQRLSAVYMVFYLLAAVVILSRSAPLDYTTWLGLFHAPLSNILTILFILLLLGHAWVGLRDILVDYVHYLPARFILMVAITVLQLGLAIWSCMALFSVVRL